MLCPALSLRLHLLLNFPLPFWDMRKGSGHGAALGSPLGGRWHRRQQERCLPKSHREGSSEGAALGTSGSNAVLLTISN